MELIIKPLNIVKMEESQYTGTLTKNIHEAHVMLGRIYDSINNIEQLVSKIQDTSVPGTGALASQVPSPKTPASDLVGKTSELFDYSESLANRLDGVVNHLTQLL